MVALVSPFVLGPALVLLAVFAAGWRHRFGALPPIRATVVVAVAALWAVYAVASIPGLLADPFESAVVVGGVLALLAVVGFVRRRARA